MSEDSGYEDLFSSSFQHSFRSVILKKASLTCGTRLCRPMETSRTVISWMIPDGRAQRSTLTERREAGDTCETGEAWTLIMSRLEPTWRKSGVLAFTCFKFFKRFIPPFRLLMTFSWFFPVTLSGCFTCHFRVEDLVRKALWTWPCPWLEENEQSTCAGRRSASR